MFVLQALFEEFEGFFEKRESNTFNNECTVIFLLNSTQNMK